MFLHLMSDILQELKALSLLLRREGLTVQMVPGSLHGALLSLAAVKVRDAFTEIKSTLF